MRHERHHRHRIPGDTGLTRALSEQARTLSYADLPDDVRALARQCVLDYVACTLAGAKEELTDILLAEKRRSRVVRRSPR